MSVEAYTGAGYTPRGSVPPVDLSPWGGFSLIPGTRERTMAIKVTSALESSLNAYRELMNQPRKGRELNEIDALMAPYRIRRKRTDTAPRFVVLPMLKRGYIGDIESDRFVDGARGLAIGMEREGQEQLWLALTSFSVDPQSRSITIVQLQAYKNDIEERHAQKEVLSHYRWEVGLVELIAKWAAQAGIEKVFMATGKDVRESSQRRDARITEKQADAIQRRYDSTAETLKLEVDPKTGKYIIPLPSV